MTPKSAEFKAAMSSARERIASAKRRGARGGFIDYYGCLSVTGEFVRMLEDAGEAAERGESAFSYSVAALILVNLAKLASSADDSAGGITEARNYVMDVLEKACSGVEYGSTEAEYIFLQSLKDSQNKAFDGWDEFAYDLLQSTARLATAKNVGKLYVALDELCAKLSKMKYASWHLECDSLVRLSAITTVDGEQAGNKYMADHLKYDGVRRIAIRKAIDEADYAYAENLCLEKVRSSECDYHWTREWYDLLFEVHLKTNDKDKQADLARDLLVNKRDSKYYAVLKELLIARGVWKIEYPSLLDSLGQNLPHHMYQAILSKEGETRRLLAVVRIYPSSVFDYGKQLSAEFPDDIYVICSEEIRRQAAEADNRIKYKRVCGLINKLFEFGGVAESGHLITELKEKHPRRPAMLEELDSLGARLAKKKK